MAKYTYILSDQQGVKEQGVIRAGSVEDAQAKLAETGKIVISIIKEKSGFFSLAGKPKLKLADKLLFIRNLNTMIKVGVTITEALELIIEQTVNKANKRMFEDISSTGDHLGIMRNGQSSAFPYRYPNFIVCLHLVDL